MYGQLLTQSGGMFKMVIPAPGSAQLSQSTARKTARD
jgi:hypothetical protein